MKFDMVEEEKSKHKEMCQSIEEYAKAELALFVNIKRFTLHLMQTGLDNWVYSEQVDYEVTKLKDELQTIKIYYFFTIKDGA